MGTTSSILLSILLIIGCVTGTAYPAAAAEISHPDLVISGITSPSSAVPGERVSLLTTVRNSGSGSASTSYTFLYLSMDTVIDPSDTYLGKVFTLSLSAGSSRSVSYYASIPAGASGTLYILAMADGSGRISEKDESNNGGISSPITIRPTMPLPVPTTSPTPVPTKGPVPSAKPDLVIGGVTAPSTVVPGEQVSLSTTIKNAGDGPASSSYVYYYLSTDNTRDSGDTYLGRSYVSTLSAGTSRTISNSVTIPSRTSGQIYICALADGTGRVSERDESNNAGTSSPVKVQSGQAPDKTPAPTPLPTSPIILKPDLVALSINGPDTGTAGSSLPLQVSVTNAGTTSSGRTAAAFYLSPDAVITHGDVYIGSLSVPSVVAGSTEIISGTVMVPATVPAGWYYLGTILDQANTIRETNEGNNIACDSGPVQVIRSVAGDPVELQVEAAILRYTNQERIAAGISPLVEHPVLTSVARAHSLDMKERNFCGHVNPDWITPFQRMAAAGYQYKAAAENIAAISTFTLNSDPDQVGRYIVEDMWMQSSGHRENILDPEFSEIGIGVVYEPDRSSSPYGFIATQNFGRPV
jgi:uncharacterized protein YkwD